MKVLVRRVHHRHPIVMVMVMRKGLGKRLSRQRNRDDVRDSELRSYSE